MSKDDTKQAIIGLTEFMKGITGNQKLKIPENIAKEYGIEQEDNMTNIKPIDEAIIQSRIQLTIWKEGCESKLDNSPKAVETLIEIARKYQKIQEIVNQKDYDRFNSRNYYGDFQRVQDIRKVLEDGNVD